MRFPHAISLPLPLAPALACASALALALAVALAPVPAKAIDLSNWRAVEEKAKGQTVHFHAWGGAPVINEYIAWAGEEVRKRYGVSVVHVKLDDTANAVAKVVAEKAVGKDQGGSIDLIWINGENFASMKKRGLLLSPGWADKLPSWAYVDHETKPALLLDFTVPVEGLEAPWGMAKLVFFHDSARSGNMPDSFAELVEWAKENPGRFAYPAPPDFIGTSFLKQALIESAPDPSVLLEPATPGKFASASAALFERLDEMHPALWRKARSFPRNKEALRRLLADNEIDIAMAFSPSEASNAIANGEIPDTVRSFVFSKGTLGNAHFVAIPYNASAKEGALAFANFLMSPEAQARKQHPEIWGDPTVLSMGKLSASERARFESIPAGIATLSAEELGPSLDEPHASWTEMLEAEWTRRYGVAN